MEPLFLVQIFYRLPEFLSVTWIDLVEKSGFGTSYLCCHSITNHLVPLKVRLLFRPFRMAENRGVGRCF